MWGTVASIGIPVVKTLVDSFLNTDKQNKTNSNASRNSNNYNLRGHENHWSVDGSIERGAHDSNNRPSSYSNIEYPAEPFMQNDRTPALRSSSKSITHQTTKAPQKSCSNCSGPSKKRDNMVKKPYKESQNHDFIMVKAPNSGNFEINIKKTESQLKNLNIRTPKGCQSNNQKSVGANNNCQRFDNNTQRHQNGNQNRQFGHQEGPQQSSSNNLQFNSGRGKKNQEKGSNLMKNKFEGHENANINNQKTVRYNNAQRVDSNPQRNHNGNQNRQFGHQKGHQHEYVNINTHNNVRVQNGDSRNNNRRKKNVTWMYLGRLKQGTTEADIRSFLNETFPGFNFQVVLLPLYRDAKLPCFKVEVDNRILEQFQQLEHWPMGVKITQYQENFKTY